MTEGNRQTLGSEGHSKHPVAGEDHPRDPGVLGLG